MVGKQHKLLGHSQALLLSSFNSIAELNMQHAHHDSNHHCCLPCKWETMWNPQCKLPRGLYVIPIPSSNKIMGSIDVRKDNQSRTLIKICKNEEKMSSFLSEKKEELNSTQFHWIALDLPIAMFFYWIIEPAQRRSWIVNDINTTNWGAPIRRSGK